ncbi:endonuclease [Vagococcus sp. JNUCC 83]
MKKLSKVILSLVSLLLLSALIFIGFLSINEYRPKDIESIKPTNGTAVIQLNTDLSMLTLNIGYAGLSHSEDFFMDGGKNVQPKSKEQVRENLTGITNMLEDHPSTIYLLQEVDLDSKRSYHINQQEDISKSLETPSVFAYNFNVPYVPFPLPPIGKVKSGIMTMTNFKMDEAKRISLPNPFSWPMRMANLKRALLETRFPISGSDKELVVFNLHLDAYDNGEGKIEQSKLLKKVLEEEYKKGNYVIAGGDFNQVFEGSHPFPKTGQDGWHPGNISTSDIPKHFSFSYDDTHPTVRVLNHAYTGDYDTSQVYVIDGFIVSDNINIKQTNVFDYQFRYTDHHPVQMTFQLQEKTN